MRRVGGVDVYVTLEYWICRLGCEIVCGDCMEGTDGMGTLNIRVVGWVGRLY